jgi:hypothetical protein
LSSMSIIIDFGLAVDEHDLIVFATLYVRPTSLLVSRRRV